LKIWWVPIVGIKVAVQCLESMVKFELSELTAYRPHEESDKTDSKEMKARLLLIFEIFVSGLNRTQNEGKGKHFKLRAHVFPTAQIVPACLR
jgi:hypothetical protein